jgi:coenzyme F420-reducing hydrogenase gamma subunit
MSVSCEYCVLSRRGLCVGPITRPEESYPVWCVSECDREASMLRRPWPTGGCCAMGGKIS